MRQITQRRAGKCPRGWLRPLCASQNETITALKRRRDIMTYCRTLILKGLVAPNAISFAVNAETWAMVQWSSGQTSGKGVLFSRS